MKKIFLFLFCLQAPLLFAQTWKITGNISASDDPFPVTGANITLKGTTIGTISDLDGNFSISASKGDILVFSFIGYKTQEKEVISDAPLKIILEPDNLMLDEVVAIGYGTMKKSDLTGAVTSVKADQLQKTPAAGLDQALQGRAAGVTVNSNSGQPGAAATIRIRGIGSAIGGNDPLYVVDGVITTDISFLSPNDIKSTEILKDASATAIYGSRGANGVILVTTKSGSQGKANISFDAYWGLQNRWKKLDLMNSKDMVMTKLSIDAMKNGAEQMAYYLNNGFNEWMQLYNIGSSEYYPVAQTAKYPNGLDYSGIETDWQDVVFNPNAFMQNYNISIDGGNDKGHYAFSSSYYTQDGTIIGSDYERLTLRFNSDYQVRDWLKVGEHLSFMTSQGRNAMNNSSSPGASIISAALAMAPWDPAYYPEGSVTRQGNDLSGQISASSNFKNVTNPLSMVEHIHPQNNTERWVGDMFVEINPIKDLTLRSSLSMDYSVIRDRSFKDKYEYSSYDKSEKNFISSSMTRYSTLLEETTLTYAKDIDRHSFSIMAGQTAEEYNYYGLSGSGASILNPVETNWYLSNATEDQTYASDTKGRIRRLSLLGRAYYSFDNRYMITLNFRADASSKFPENLWGYFPSTALAWRISEEEWMKDFRDLDQLKLRLGWGNQEKQYYTDRSENLRIEDGCLVIEARQEQYENNNYTSARITTKNKKDFVYGKIEARISLPSGRGTWPAFWMLGYGGWPTCGEIDIMEHVGSNPTMISHALHTRKKNGSNGTNWSYRATVENVEGEFHIYGIEWLKDYELQRDAIRFYIDDEVSTIQYEPTAEPDFEQWPFNDAFYIILNLAIGGTMGGSINTDIFADPENNPVLMKVDWVRVYQKQI